MHATLCQLTTADTTSHYQCVTLSTAPASRGDRFAGHIATLIRAGLSCGAVALLTQLASAAELAIWSGHTPPRFNLPANGGGDVALAAGSSRAVLVHYFATWCEPCREELPALSRLAQRAGPSIKVIAISVEEPDRRVHNFFDSMPVSFPVLLDRDRAVAKAWKVTTLPTTFVLDSDLRPRLIAETELAWDKIEPAALIGTIAASEATPQQHSSKQN